MGGNAGVAPAGSPLGSADGGASIPTLSECLSTTFSPTSAVLSAEALTVPGDSPPAPALDDSLFEGMPVDHEGASPHKRRAPSQAGPTAPASVEQQGFLVAITDMLRGELQAGFATQQSRINEEIGEAMAKVNKRVEAVEKGVTKQLQQTLATIQDLAVKQEKQAVTLVQTGAETKQLVNRVLALEEQLAQLKKDQVQNILQPHGDIHQGLKEAAMAVTTTRTSARYRESTDLKKLRRQAQLTPPGPARRSIFAKEDPSAVRREDELRPIMARWKNNKRGGLGRLLWLLNDILYVSKLPAGLDDGLAILLPKVPAPLEFADTRPIALSNILLKTLAQLLLKRGLPLLRPIGNLQFCKTGSQSVELIMALRRLAQQAHEWREKFWIIKLDVRKAFDSISQQYLSTLVTEKVGDTLPWEARAWLQVIGARGFSADSPSLFSAGIGEAIDQVIQDMEAHEIRGDHPRLPPAPFGIGAFMDDTYVWGANKAWVQQCLHEVVKRFAERGLEINPKKTMVMCSMEEGGSFTIGGQTVNSLGPEAIMPVLGSPVTFVNAPGAIVSEMQHRARKSFHANRQLLCCAEAKLDDRLRSSITLLRSAALWACETWPISDYLLRTANSLQYHYVREIIGRKRKPQEEWLSWNQRRWSSFILRVRWQLLGHVARHPGPTREILSWRNLEWWRAEQQLPDRVRAKHPHQYNTQLDDERKVAKVAGDDWQQVAQHRERWAAKTDEFVLKFDVEWATGKQAQLGNIQQGRSGTAKGKGKRRGHSGRPPAASPGLLAITGG
ncbi:unnamed protein product, partial [Symbiodinium necroappetens]